MDKVRFIAEISSNHNRDLGRALKMIEAAYQSGCDGVKFQLFKIEDLFAPEILVSSEAHRKRKQWELPLEFIPVLSGKAHELGLEFSCTPFYLEAVKELEPFVDFYKIASYELLWHKIFLACIQTGKPLVFSTGMATLPEIADVLNSLNSYKGSNITILRCTSAYPTPLSDANLSSIDSLRSALSTFERDFQLSYGWSDHTVSAGVVLSAILKHRASFVEFHLDLEGKGDEYSAGHCWLPEQIASVIKMIKEAGEASGDGEIDPRGSEIADRKWRADPVDGLRPLKEIRDFF